MDDQTMRNGLRGDWWRRAFCTFCLLGAILPRDVVSGLVRGGKNPLPTNWVWPTQKVIVPALVAPLGARTGWSIPSWLSALKVNDTSLYTYQTTHPNSPHYARTSRVGLENMSYFRFIIDYYDRLPEYTVFVHNDVYSHNPHWLHWLECLRTDRIIPWATLSPNYVSHRADEGKMGADLFYKAFMNSTEGLDPPRNRTFPCCELWLMHRSTILRWPKRVYVELMDSLVDHKINARVFEYGLHYAMLGNSLLGRAHKPCQIYKCWCEECRRARVGMIYFSWHRGSKMGFAGNYYFNSFGTSEKSVDMRVKNMCVSKTRFCSLVHARSLLKGIQSCDRPLPPQTELDQWDEQLSSWPLKCANSDRRCWNPANRFEVTYFPNDDPWKAYTRAWPA